MWFYLETEGHDFTGQTVASEESLHGVSQLYLLGEHIPQQLIQQVARVKQCHQHTGQLVLKKTQEDTLCFNNYCLKFSYLHRGGKPFSWKATGHAGVCSSLALTCLDLSQNLHEGGPCLQVLMVAQTWRRVDGGGRRERQSDTGGTRERLRFDCSFWKLWSLVDGRTNIIAFLAL